MRPPSTLFLAFGVLGVVSARSLNEAEASRPSVRYSLSPRQTTKEPGSGSGSGSTQPSCPPGQEGCKRDVQHDGLEVAKLAARDDEAKATRLSVLHSLSARQSAGGASPGGGQPSCLPGQVGCKRDVQHDGIEVAKLAARDDEAKATRLSVLNPLSARSQVSQDDLGGGGHLIPIDCPRGQVCKKHVVDGAEIAKLAARDKGSHA